ncbi:23S rRNA (uracil(1939)-C(5))-methyltransferase RlmD [Marinospirillum insulare]|uniref:23S rRNA (uracil(1939)-C(5))-methyltransferase RlmD n=1 Tax=Marinospirillum insulare TaxID=217169 RepID=A0ABQ5ZTG6_9GAMM|nr:23S rRNA (uracil(1939)-C(5))-methyltransferase RlmD [Marinospirillum insulare]GLR62726.1 23S rRNA (uracil(1939)-C(5))-methyltransferase RlmD [Marinospirillum insulare]
MSLFAKPRKNSAKAKTPAKKPQLPKNPTIQDENLAGMAILRLSHEGRGVGRNAAGKTVFVEGALPGERVTYKVRFTRSRYDEAVLDKVLQPSPQRQEPKCEHYGVCGGCNLQHLQTAAQVAFKQSLVAELMQQPEETFQPAITSQPFSYRRKARLGIKWRKDGSLLLGFREKSSAFITNILHCPILTEKLQPLLPALHNFLPRLEGKKHLGHIELVAGENQIGVLVRLLRPLARLTHNDQGLWQTWAKEQGILLLLQDEEGFHSLDIETDADLDNQNTSSLFSYPLEDQTLFFAGNDFVQVNAAVNEQMVHQALSWLDLQGNEKVLDLFCGFGNFTLPLAKQTSQLVGVEGSPSLVARAKANAKHNQLTNTQFISADLNLPLKQQAWLTEDNNSWDVVLLDPPRAGAEAICQQIGKLDVKKLLYISCNPATLARDSALLLQAGFELSKLGIMDMFPQTAHVESMALFVQP